MSLGRKDVRVYFDADMHKAIANLAERDQVELQEWIERAAVDEVLRRAHAARLDAGATEHLGKSRDAADSRGTSRGGRR